MFFLSTVAGLFVLLIWCHLIGRRLVPLLPWEVRPVAREYLAPVLGLAVLVLAVTPWGWWGFGFRGFGGLGCLAASAALAWHFEPDRRGFLASALRQANLGLVATLPFLLQLMRFDCFDLFNDPYTYLVQSQWLQQHGLATGVAVTNEQGVLAQVAFSQATGTRVSAQFVLAFVQGAFGFRWAHEAYPVAICLALATGCGSVGAAAAWSGRAGRWLPALTVVLTGLLQNGFVFGAVRGFLPQTFGLAFGLGALLVVGAVCNAARRRDRPSGPAVLTGLLLTALTLAYPELLPLVGVACALAWVVFLRRQPRSALRFAAGTAGAVLLLANFELLRTVPGLFLQSKAVVGTGIPWTLAAFFRHALGGQAGFMDGSVPFGGWEWLGWAIVLLTIVAVALSLCWQPSRTPALALGAFVLVSAALFVYYRTRLSPFPVGTGQSWSQFKLSSWAGLPVAALAAMGVARLWHLFAAPGCASTWPQRALLALLGAVATLGLGQAWTLADARTAAVRQEFGFGPQPLAGLTQWAQSIKTFVPPTEPVLLRFPAEQIKSQQFLAYALLGRRVQADWANDPFALAQIPEPQRTADRTRTSWVVEGRRAGWRAPGAVARLGNYILLPAPRFWLEPGTSQGGYPREHFPGGWLVWTRQQIAFETLVVPGPARASEGGSILHVRGALLTPIPALELALEVLIDGVVAQREMLPTAAALNAWTAPAPFERSFRLPAGVPRSVTIRFSTPQLPVRLTPGDTREVAYFVRDLHLEVETPP